MRRLAILTAPVLALSATIASAGCPEGSTPMLTCAIEGRATDLSICIDATAATYRYGPSDAAPDLTLSVPLFDLEYLREGGPGSTIDEIVTFRNEDYAYRISLGFRVGLDPDPTELREYGDLKVTRGGTDIASLTCDPARIDRSYDLLLSRMAAIGRTETTDGDSFPNYDLDAAPSAADSPPCEQDYNVDTCWSRGVRTARNGDLPGALEHYSMSCDAGLQMAGCYEAGKLALLNRELRDYPRAYGWLRQVCESDAVGQGPYACKYLGWMHHTGIGAAQVPDRARDYLTMACFTQNDVPMIDPEGCHFLGEALLRDGADDEAVFLALAMGCTDGSEGLCDETRAAYAAAAKRGAGWLPDCDTWLDRSGTSLTCGGLAASRDWIAWATDGASERQDDLRRNLLYHFRKRVDDGR